LDSQDGAKVPRMNRDKRNDLIFNRPVILMPMY
jgi:hypothetical protein